MNERAESEVVRRARVAWRRLQRAASAGEADVLQVLLEGGNDAVFVVDAERNLLAFNRRAEQITGFSREEVLGRHCLAGFRCEHCLEACNVFARGEVRGAAVELVRRDGSRAGVVKDARVLRDRAGEVLGAIEIFRERRADPDVVEGTGACGSAAAFHGVDVVLAALGRCLFVLDASFVVQRVSSSFSDLLGRDAGHLVGKPAEVAFGPGLLGPESAFRRALAQGERREGWRASMTLADGSGLPVSVSGAPLPTGSSCGAGGAASAFVLVVRPESAPAPTGAEHRTPQRYEGMVGESPSMRRVFDLVEQLRDNDATVVITGESGTGKELVARAVHARSARAAEPFVAVNCAALPESLLESELFGHVRGAFTGALRDKLGRFEVVKGGTLFLDEIGDLPLPLQAKLLRVLQERTFERVGDSAPRAFRGRVLAATHQDLQRAVAGRAFREDLYYRLNVVQIRLPPLRARREDIEPLAAHLLSKIGERRSRALRLSPSALRALLTCDWPGNVRQLENALEYATAVCGGQTIHVDDLPPEVVAPPAPRALQPASASLPAEAPAPISARVDPLGAYPSAAEILAALEKTRRRRGDAAKLLGVSRTTMWRRMRELGLC